MDAVACDAKGRIVLPKSVRESYGSRFVVVPALHEIVLMPVPENPVKTLGELGRKSGVHKKSLEQLREAINQQAAEELVRRH